MSLTIPIDHYILDTLMRDLTRHDKRPSAFLVYLHLWRETYGRATPATNTAGKPVYMVSLQRIAFATGLSKSSVQHALRCLIGRKLVLQHKSKPTAVPVYRVMRPWRRKRG
jgi:hypothetical protein